jgi:hypothetical protein
MDLFETPERDLQTLRVAQRAAEEHRLCNTMG